jgi:RNA polymerase sigma-B factor
VVLPVTDTLAQRDTLVERHRGLAVSLAARFAGRGEDMDDLIQVALLALTNAVDRYDPERGFALTTFATATILGELKRHFRDRAWAIRPPRRVHELYLRIQPTMDELSQELGRSPRIAEVARRVGASEEDVIEALEAGTGRSATSLDAFHADGDASSSLAAQMGATDARMAEIENELAVRPLLARLPAREREIIWLRFFDGLSQSEIATRVGVSQMHVSRLLTRSLDRLRDLSREIAG